jgi:thioredoxin-like negative regulator of GroEL
MEQVERLRNWLELVDRYARMARNPVDAGIAAVINANDLLRPRGTQAAIDYFNKLLSEVKNDAVQRAIRLQLVELYRSGGQEEKALEQLRTLMIAAPAGEVPDGPVRERPAQR